MWTALSTHCETMLREQGKRCKGFSSIVARCILCKCIGLLLISIGLRSAVPEREWLATRIARCSLAAAARRLARRSHPHRQGTSALGKRSSPRSPSSVGVRPLVLRIVPAAPRACRRVPVGTGRNRGGRVTASQQRGGDRCDRSTHGLTCAPAASSPRPCRARTDVAVEF